jgi:uncharacterized protein involved in exopolysaccharide biosynthesis
MRHPVEFQPHECKRNQERVELMQTSPKSHAVMEETPDVKATFAPEWNESLTRERILPRLRLLFGMRRFLLRCAVVGFVVVTLIAFLIPNEYESTARLMPPDSQPGGGLALMAMLGSGSQNGSSSGLGALATDFLGAKTTGAVFIAVMRSRTAEDRIIQRFDLKKVYSMRLEDSARKRLEINTAIIEDRKSGVITVSTVDHDAKRAAAITAAYIDQLDTLIAQLNTSSAHRERVFLEERLDKVKVDLEAAEKDFSQFASKNATIDISAQGRAMLEGAASLQGQLIGAESQLEGLRQIYSDNNIRVRTTQARIAELRSQLQKMGGTSGGAAPSDQSATDNDYPTLRQLPILGVPYADKFRQLKLQEAVYETLTKQFELAKVQEAKEIPSVKVLDQPEVPERKSYPPRTLIIIAGTACSVLLGAAWVLGTARWRQIDPHDPGMKFAQEVFGTVRAGMPWVSANGSNGNGGANGHSGRSGKGTDERSKAASA